MNQGILGSQKLELVLSSYKVEAGLFGNFLSNSLWEPNVSVDSCSNSGTSLSKL